MLIVFGLEGFSELTVWPVFFFFSFLYMLAIGLGAHFYKLQRLIVSLISLIVFVSLLFDGAFPSLSVWLDVTAIASLVLLLVLRQPLSLRFSSAILLSAIWLYVATRFNHIHVELNLAVAIHTLWRAVHGEAIVNGILPPLITVVSTRFYFAFIAALIGVGVNERRRHIAELRLLPLFTPTKRRYPLQRFKVRPRSVNISNPLDGIVAAALWVAFPLINTTAYVWLHLKFILLNAWSISVYAVLIVIRAILRLMIYTFTLLIHVGIGFFWAGWHSVRIMITVVATGCLLVVVPVLWSAVFAREFALTAAAIDREVHQPSSHVLNLWGQLLFSVLIFAFGVCIPLWSTDPTGTGVGWWRDIMGNGIGLDMRGWQQFKEMFSSQMNFLRNICVRLIPAYFFGLLAYDLLGRFVGGPYQFGYLFWTCLGLLGATLLLNIVRGRKMWTIVR
jgi:hypothetical protein